MSMKRTVTSSWWQKLKHRLLPLDELCCWVITFLALFLSCKISLWIFYAYQILNGTSKFKLTENTKHSETPPRMWPLTCELHLRPKKNRFVSGFKPKKIRVGRSEIFFFFFFKFFLYTYILVQLRKKDFPFKNLVKTGFLLKLESYFCNCL